MCVIETEREAREKWVARSTEEELVPCEGHAAEASSN